MSIDDLLAFAAGAQFAIDSNAHGHLDDDDRRAHRTAGGHRMAGGARQPACRRADAPICRTEYYINRAFAAVGRLLQRHSGPIFPLIEDLFGVSVVEVRQHIRAVIVAAELADGTAVEAGTAALQMQRSYTTSEGEIAQVTVNTHPSTTFRYSMTMHRVKGLAR